MTSGVRLTAEFVGLPGSGKSTVCSRVNELLTAADIKTVSTSDFVQWNSARGKSRKIVLTLRHPLLALRRLVGALRFWHSLEGRQREGLVRALEAPVIAACLDRFLDTVDSDVALLDQADVQGIWSIGALSREHAPAATTVALKATRPPTPRLYVCMQTDAALAQHNLRLRAHGGSRFDTMSPEQGTLFLQAATPLMDMLIELLRSSPAYDKMILDASDSIESKATCIADEIKRRLGRARAEGTVRLHVS